MRQNKRPATAAINSATYRRHNETDDDDPFFEKDVSDGDDDYNDVEETAEEKKLKIAKAYLAKVRDEIDEGESDVDTTIKRRLFEQQEDQSRMRNIAASIELHSTECQQPTAFYPTSKWDPTSVSVTSDGKSIYVVDKNGGICSIDTETGQKTKIPLQRDFEKLAMAVGPKAEWVKTSGSYGISRRALITSAVTDDGRFLAVAGGDKHIHIFDITTHTCTQSLSGHREAVSGIVFQPGTHKLLSCSYDRTVKTWSLDDLGYTDTLFGHQSEIFDIDAFQANKAVTSGNDRSCRLWKLATESQLVFRAPSLSVDCCRMINGSCFVSGSSDGLQLWNIAKKKPIAAVATSWVHSIATLHNTDLLVSGSDDGVLKLWEVVEDEDKGRLRAMRSLGSLPSANGYAVSVELAQDGLVVFGAVSRRPRLGSWTSLCSPVTNGVVVHRFRRGD